MNEIIKNDYTEIQKYFDDYYKEQLEKYESLKDYDNYLFTEVKYEPNNQPLLELKNFQNHYQ